MIAYTIRRIILMVPLLLAIATVTFFLMHAIQGGPFDQEKPLPPATKLALEQRYGLAEPLGKQYVTYLQNLTHFDFGISIATNRPVRDIIGERFPISVQLGVCAFIFAMLGGLILGALAALNQNGIGDYIGVFVATAGSALPGFILAPILVITFVLHFHWFDVLGWELGNYHKMVLPIVAFGMLPMALVARITRASMLDVLRQDYIRTARAKGVTEFAVVMRHAAKNALIPVLTISGPVFAGLITGSFIIERAFAIPGLGQEFVNAVLVRDYGEIMGVTLFYAFIFAVMTLAGDLMYAVADPRIRF